MKKTDEIANPTSCLNRARDNELIFVLLEHDAAAPFAIRQWVEERVRLGKNKPGDDQLLEALDIAEQMEN